MQRSLAGYVVNDLLIYCSQSQVAHLISNYNYKSWPSSSAQFTGRLWICQALSQCCPCNIHHWSFAVLLLLHFKASVSAYALASFSVLIVLSLFCTVCRIVLST